MNLKMAGGIAILAYLGVQGINKADHKNKAIEETALAYKLNDKEKLAFNACVRQTDGLILADWKVDGRNIKAGRVPIEVCACHAEKMAEIFSPGKYDSHGQLLKAIASKDITGNLVLDSKELNSNWNGRSELATNRVLVGISKCVEIERKKMEARFRRLS